MSILKVETDNYFETCSIIEKSSKSITYRHYYTPKLYNLLRKPELFINFSPFYSPDPYPNTRILIQDSRINVDPCGSRSTTLPTCYTYLS
jgi:hypothetical protein